MVADHRMLRSLANAFAGAAIKPATPMPLFAPAAVYEPATAVRAGVEVPTPWVVSASPVMEPGQSPINTAFWGTRPSYLRLAWGTGNVRARATVDLPIVGTSVQLPPAQEVEVQPLLGQPDAGGPPIVGHWNVLASPGALASPINPTYTTYALSLGAEEVITFPVPACAGDFRVLLADYTPDISVVQWNTSAVLEYSNYPAPAGQGGQLAEWRSVHPNAAYIGIGSAVGATQVALQFRLRLG